MTSSFQLSDRLIGIQESSTLKMNAIARDLTAKGIAIFNLTAGEPDFPILQSVKKKAIQAIEENFSKYTAVQGVIELRQALSKKFLQQNNLHYSPDEIIVTAGAKQAIFSFLLSVLNPQDEVLIPIPYWVSYPEIVKVAGGKPIFIPTDAKHGFKLKPETLKARLTSKTKVFILNSPSNPTGCVYSRSELEAFAHVLKGSSVMVISDEIYEKIIYDGAFTSFASISEDAWQRTLTVNGFSKAYSMTGWRLGYAAGPKPFISAMTLLQGQSTSNANSVAQKAALDALSLPDSELSPMIDSFKMRCNKMVEIFSRCKLCSFVKPQGAFYFFLSIEPVLGKRYTKSVDGEGSILLQGSEDVAFYLLNEAQVVTVPGAGFGDDRYLRLSFAVSDFFVDEGCRRIVQALERLV